MFRASRARGLRDTFIIGVCTPDFSMKFGSTVTNIVFFDSKTIISRDAENK